MSFREPEWLFLLRWLLVAQLAACPIAFYFNRDPTLRGVGGSWSLKGLLGLVLVGQRKFWVAAAFWSVLMAVGLLLAVVQSLEYRAIIDSDHLFTMAGMGFCVCVALFTGGTQLLAAGLIFALAWLAKEEMVEEDHLFAACATFVCLTAIEVNLFVKLQRREKPAQVGFSDRMNDREPAGFFFLPAIRYVMQLRLSGLPAQEVVIGALPGVPPIGDEDRVLTIEANRLDSSTPAASFPKAFLQRHGTVLLLTNLQLYAMQVAIQERANVHLRILCCVALGLLSLVCWLTETQKRVEAGRLAALRRSDEAAQLASLALRGYIRNHQMPHILDDLEAKDPPVEEGSRTSWRIFLLCLVTIASVNLYLVGGDKAAAGVAALGAMMIPFTTRRPRADLSDDGHPFLSQWLSDRSVGSYRRQWQLPVMSVVALGGVGTLQLLWKLLDRDFKERGRNRDDESVAWCAAAGWVAVLLPFLVELCSGSWVRNGTTIDEELAGLITLEKPRDMVHMDESPYQQTVGVFRRVDGMGNGTSSNGSFKRNGGSESSMASMASSNGLTDDNLAMHPLRKVEGSEGSLPGRAYRGERTVQLTELSATLRPPPVAVTPPVAAEGEPRSPDSVGSGASRNSGTHRNGSHKLRAYGNHFSGRSGSGSGSGGNTPTLGSAGGESPNPFNSMSRGSSSNSLSSAHSGRRRRRAGTDGGLRVKIRWDAPRGSNSNAVGFAQDAKEKASKPVVLEWPAGTIVAVDGEPGSGKSRLLAKILDQVPKADVAFVPQRNWFFRGTLVSNIALGAKVRASRLQKVVEMAGLNECLSRLPLGVQTTIDEFGRPLSHCEQRQVCLARAFYQFSDYVIIDELGPLDPRAVQAVRVALAGPLHNKVVIVAGLPREYAHRTLMVSPHGIQQLYEDTDALTGEVHLPPTTALAPSATIGGPPGAVKSEGTNRPLKGVNKLFFGIFACVVPLSWVVGRSTWISLMDRKRAEVELTWFETHVIDFATLAATMQIVIHLLAEAQVQIYIRRVLSNAWTVLDGATDAYAIRAVVTSMPIVSGLAGPVRAALESTLWLVLALPLLASRRGHYVFAAAFFPGLVLVLSGVLIRAYSQPVADLRSHEHANRVELMSLLLSCTRTPDAVVRSQSGGLGLTAQGQHVLNMVCKSARRVAEAQYSVAIVCASRTALALTLGVAAVSSSLAVSDEYRQDAAILAMVWFPAALAASTASWTYLEAAASHMRRLQPREGASAPAGRSAGPASSRAEPSGLELAATPLLERRASIHTKYHPDEIRRAQGVAPLAPLKNAAISIRELTVRGNLERCILDSVRLEVGRGRKVAIVGSSGEGKTALLHVLQGRLIPTQGSVKIHEREVCTLRHGEKGKMYAPNHPFFSPTPRAQLALDAQEKINEEDWVALLESLGLNPRSWRLGLDTPTLELPGSDWEALSLARTILEPSDPNQPLYLLDMPPRNCLKTVLNLEGTVICVLPTKDVHETTQGFDEVVLMSQGRVARQGSPEALEADLRSLHYGLWEGLVKAEPTLRNKCTIGTAPLRFDT